jgi:hypothetical protein
MMLHSASPRSATRATHTAKIPNFLTTLFRFLLLQPLFPLFQFQAPPDQMYATFGSGQLTVLSLPVLAKQRVKKTGGLSIFGAMGAPDLATLHSAKQNLKASASMIAKQPQATLQVSKTICGLSS